tara:strand:- start:16086 stop:16382 length:297 start_codon:yes stop_codon:yes gene_type:complete
MLKKNLTRKDLIKKLHQKLGFSKNFLSKITDDFFESLINELIIKKKVKISSFGTFAVINKNERIGRNPKTKEIATISARKVVKFTPSLIIKKKLNKNV